MQFVGDAGVVNVGRRSAMSEPCGCSYVPYENSQAWSSGDYIKWCPLHARAEQTKRERDALLKAMNQIAHDPQGPADASALYVLECVVDIATKAITACEEKP